MLLTTQFNNPLPVSMVMISRNHVKFDLMYFCHICAHKFVGLRLLVGLRCKWSRDFATGPNSSPSPSPCTTLVADLKQLILSDRSRNMLSEQFFYLHQILQPILHKYSTRIVDDVYLFMSHCYSVSQVSCIRA